MRNLELLETFIGIERLSNVQLGWKAGIRLTFVVSGVPFAIANRSKEGKGEE